MRAVASASSVDESRCPEAVNGDKRVLILGGDVLPYTVQKLPSNDDFKFCEHNDEHVKKALMSESERQSYLPVAKKLNELGIFMAGLDVISGKIIEVNVTSPCYFIREINNHFGCHLEDTIADYIISKVESTLFALK